MTGDHAVTAQRADAASAARKRFAAGKTLAQAESTSAEPIKYRRVEPPLGGGTQNKRTSVRMSFCSELRRRRRLYPPGSNRPGKFPLRPAVLRGR